MDQNRYTRRGRVAALTVAAAAPVVAIALSAITNRRHAEQELGIEPRRDGSR